MATAEKPRGGAVVGGGGTAARRAAKGTTSDHDAPKRPVKQAGTAPDVAGKPAPASEASVALIEQRDFLLASLRDLEHEHDAGDVDDADYESLKDDYTARAAAVIRRIDALEEASSRKGVRRRVGPRTVLTVAGVLVVAIVAGVVMAQASGRREAGDSLSGDIRQSSRDLLLKAQGQFGEGKLLDAIKTYDEALAVQPANREALTYKGWMLHLAAQSAASAGVAAPDVEALRARSIQSLDEAVKVDPTYADARVFRAIIFNDAGRSSDAIAELDRVDISQVPEFMRQRVEDLRSKAAQSSGSTATTRVAVG